MIKCIYMVDGFQVVPKMEHYEIYKEGNFIESCDCNELNQTILELKENKKETALRFTAVSF